MKARVKFCTRGHNMDKTRKTHPNGDTYCSMCKVLRTKVARKKYPDRSKKYCRNSNLRRNYGIESSEYDRILISQNGVCAVCGNGPGRKKLSVDHCHITGQIRGLLCHSCNTALGLLAEDATRISNLINYLIGGDKNASNYREAEKNDGNSRTRAVQTLQEKQSSIGYVEATA